MPAWFYRSFVWWHRSLCVLLLGGFVMIFLGYRLNVSPSVPLGLYRVMALTGHPARGMLVHLPVPTAIQLWQPRYLRLLKPVAGIAGDTVCIEEDGVMVNGTDYGSVEQQAAGKALPRIRGCFVVPQDEVFLASQTPRSVDSRYFGTVQIVRLTGVANPIWTW